jgi:hypothetical protein
MIFPAATVIALLPRNSISSSTSTFLPKYLRDFPCQLIERSYGRNIDTLTDLESIAVYAGRDIALPDSLDALLSLPDGGNRLLR